MLLCLDFQIKKCNDKGKIKMEALLQLRFKIEF